MSNTLKNGMVSLKKSMTLGGTRNVAMTAVGQVLAANAADPTHPKSTPPVNILSRSTRNIAARGNYWRINWAANKWKSPALLLQNWTSWNFADETTIVILETLLNCH